MKVGVIGVGMVGRAVLTAFSYAHDTVGFDLKIAEFEGNYEQVLKCDLIFVCVPTPTLNGEQDTSALHSVLDGLSVSKFPGVVVVKCTVLPGTMDKMATLFPNLYLVHNPEFLTAKAAFKDFMQQKEIMLSGASFLTDIVRNAYSKILPGVPVRNHCMFKATELAKYMSNCFLASKVSWCNEFKEMCDALKVSYAIVRNLACGQGLIGDNHTFVPGNDSKTGYGGACFPKDVTALLTYCEQNGITLNMLEKANEVNSRYRSFNNKCEEIG